MPDKIFIDTNIVIYALGQASTKAHLAAVLCWYYYQAFSERDGLVFESLQL